MAGEVGFATFYPHHCERSEAIHLSACGKMDCFVATLLAMTEGAGASLVGWVERSETHAVSMMGFASLYPSYDFPSSLL